MGSLRIIQSGMFSTIQDLGRYGHQSRGISVSGAMDQISCRLANILVGNDENMPCIEMTVKGDRIQFDSDALIAITGSDMDFTVNGYKIDINRTIFINAGDVLDCGYCKTKKLSYMSIRGRYDVEKILGSSATFLRAGIGGYKGRRLMNGDVLSFPDLEESMAKVVKVSHELIDMLFSPRTIRFVFGNEKDRFTGKGIHTFLDSTYTIQNDSDRMGYRFSGNAVEHTTDSNIISGGINFGSIQIPGNGQPIVMMADRQTTGGYTKVGQVIQADLPYLSQKKPLESIQFEAVTVEEAIALWKKINKKIEQWKCSIGYGYYTINEGRRFNIRFNNMSFNVKVTDK